MTVQLLRLVALTRDGLTLTTEASGWGAENMLTTQMRDYAARTGNRALLSVTMFAVQDDGSAAIHACWFNGRYIPYTELETPQPLAEGAK